MNKKDIFLILIIIINFTVLGFILKKDDTSSQIAMIGIEEGESKYITEIPNIKGLGFSYECADGLTTIVWDDDNRELKFKINSAPTSCMLTFDYDITINLEKTSTEIKKGKSETIKITGENFENLVCVSANPSIASCLITNSELIVTAEEVGETTITVGEKSKNETVSLNVTVTGLGLKEPEGTLYIGGDALTIELIGETAEMLSCTSSDESIAKCSVSSNILTVMPGTKTGNADITVKGSENTAIFKATVKAETKLSLTPNSGILYVGGTNQTANIISENAGTITCSSSAPSVASCTVSGTVLTVTPKASAGDAVITVKESNGNKTAIYNATVINVTLSLSPTSGTTLKGSSLTSTISGSNYGNLSCTSSVPTVASCLVNGNILTINGLSEGTAQITLKSSNSNVNAIYTVTVLSSSSGYEYICEFQINGNTNQQGYQSGTVGSLSEACSDVCTKLGQTSGLFTETTGTCSCDDGDSSSSTIDGICKKG